MLTQRAKESGIATPTTEDLVRLARARNGKRLSNAAWTSTTDPQARIAKLKDGRTPLASKPEPAVDRDTGVIVAAALPPADYRDTTTLPGTLAAAAKNLAPSDAAPTQDAPSERVADQGYHSRAVLQHRDGGVWKTRSAEPRPRGLSRWHGEDKARAAVYANRTRLGWGIGKQAMRRRAAIVERSFAHTLDRGGRRRTWLRGPGTVHKRSLVHVAGHNLGILMRRLIGAGTPKEAAARALACRFFFYTQEAMAIVLVIASSDRFAVLVMAVTADPG
jgi:transposase